MLPHVASTLHLWETGTLNWTQFMLQWLSVSLNSLNSVKVTLTFRKNSSKSHFPGSVLNFLCIAIKQNSIVIYDLRDIFLLIHKNGWAFMLWTSIEGLCWVVGVCRVALPWLMLCYAVHWEISTHSQLMRGWMNTKLFAFIHVNPGMLLITTKVHDNRSGD